MKEINRIDHIGIRITDLDASRRFYEQLGFEFLIGPIGPEPVAIMEHPSGVNINLIINANTDTGNNVLMDIEEKHPGYTHFALGVTNIKAVMNTIKELEIPISGGPITLPDGGVMFFIRDPDWNVIEFHQDP